MVARALRRLSSRSSGPTAQSVSPVVTGGRDAERRCLLGGGRAALRPQVAGHKLLCAAKSGASATRQLQGPCQGGGRFECQLYVKRIPWP